MSTVGGLEDLLSEVFDDGSDFQSSLPLVLRSQLRAATSFMLATFPEYLHSTRDAGAHGGLIASLIRHFPPPQSSSHSAGSPHSDIRSTYDFVYFNIITVLISIDRY